MLFCISSGRETGNLFGVALHTPYEYETYKRHCLQAGFAPLYYIRVPFTANSSFQNFIRKIS